MENRYCNITGSQKIMDTYDLIPKGFSKVQVDMDEVMEDTDDLQRQVNKVVVDRDTTDGNLQRQINSLVVDGDSSPAIDQALAGTGFETLREYREHTDVSISDLDSQLAEMVYLQEEEPTNINTKTLWFDINSTINFSEGGVAIENAETSTTPPSTPYWFEPV